MNGSGPLDFDATIDAKQFNAMLDEMGKRIRGTGDTVVKEGNRIDAAFRNIGAGLTAYFGGQFFAGLAKDIGQTRGEFQQLEIAFETMLKNKELSDKLMADVVDFAAKTPFDLKQVATGAKQLLAYRTQANEIIPTMRKLGDVAAGLSIPFGDLVYLYGTSATQGKLMTKDLMQFAGRGIPIIDELSKVLNVSKSRILEMASEGAIGFEHLQTVINNLTDSAGMFGGMMDKQAASITGLYSNLQDAWSRMLNDMGKDNQGTYEDTIKLATSAIENYQRVLDVLKVVVATYGTYRAAILLNTVALKLYNKALTDSIIKEKALQILRSFNPWGLALASITAVIGALWVYNRAAKERNDVEEQIIARTTQEVGAAKQLFNILEQTNLKGETRRTIIEKINKEYGSYLPNLLTEKSSLSEIRNAYEAINISLRERIELQVKESKAKELYLSLFELEEEYKRISAQSKDEYNKENQIIEGVKGAARGRALSNLKKSMNEIRTEYNKILNDLSNKGSLIVAPDPDPDPETVDKSKQTLEQKLKEIQKLYENYYQWAERYGKESADKQFEDLKAGGESFLEYLESRIKEIEGKAVKSPKERDSLSTYLATKNDLLGSKSRIDMLKEELSEMKEQAVDAIDYLERLKEKTAKIGTEDKSEQGFFERQILGEEIVSTEKQIAKEAGEAYKKLLNDSNDFAEKRKAITKEYAALERNLSKELLGPEKYEQALKYLKEQKAEKEKILALDEVKGTDAYKSLANDIDRLTRIEAKAYLDTLKIQLKTLQEQPEAYKEIASFISQTENQLKTWSTQELATGLQDAAKGFEDMLNVMFELDNEFSAIARQIAGIIGELGNVMSSFNEGSFTNPVQAAFSVGSLIFKTVDLLDKQFGLQKRIKEQEEQRLRYNLEMQMVLGEIEESLQKQLDILNDLGMASAYGDSIVALNLYIKEAGEALKKLKLDLKNAPPGVKISFDIDILQGIYKVQDAMTALNKALADGLITQEQYDLAVQYLNSIEGAEKRLKELRQQHKDYLVGTVGDLTSLIEEMFMQGEISAQSFANNFERMMRQAIVRGIMMRGMTKELEAWLDRLYQGAMAGGENSESWMAEMQMGLEAIYAKYEGQLSLADGMLDKVFGTVGAAGNSLSGSIKGVTEQTAGVLAGQINAIRVNQAHALTLMDNQLLELSKIEFNTRYNRHLSLLIDIRDILRGQRSDSVIRNRAQGGN